MKPQPLSRKDVAALLTFTYGAEHLNDELLSVEALVAHGPVSVWISPTGAYHVGMANPGSWTEVAFITHASLQGDQP